MSSRIKGITVEIGGDTSGLEKSLAILKTLDHNRVFEDETLLVIFLDGSEIECRSEEA